MEYIKKYGVQVLSVIALIALFFPMASVTVEGGYMEQTTSVSGLTCALQGYIAMILFLGPLALLFIDFLPKYKPHKNILTLLVPVICIIIVFIAYSQASGFASVADNEYVECYSSLGFGGYLCLIAHIGTLVFGLYNNKELITNLIKGQKTGN